MSLNIFIGHDFFIAVLGSMVDVSTDYLINADCWTLSFVLVFHTKMNILNYNCLYASFAAILGYISRSGIIFFIDMVSPGLLI